MTTKTKNTKPTIEMIIGAALALGATRVCFRCETRESSYDRIGRWLKIETFVENYAEIMDDMLRKPANRGNTLAVEFWKTDAKTFVDAIFEKGEHRVGLAAFISTDREGGKFFGKLDHVFLKPFEQAFPGATYENRTRLEFSCYNH